MAAHSSLHEVKKWSVDETAEWAVREGFSNYTAALISREINGSKLLELQEFQVRNIFRNKALEKKFLEKLRNLSINAQESNTNQRSKGYDQNREQNMFGRNGGRPQAVGFPPVTRRPQNNAQDRPALPPQRLPGANIRTSYNSQYPTQPNLPEQYNPDDEFDDEWDDDDIDDPTFYQNNGRALPAEMDGFKQQSQNGSEGGYGWGEHRQDNFSSNVRPLNQPGYRFDNANPSVPEQQNSQPTTQTKKNYTQCIPRNQRPPPSNPVSDRRPAEPSTRPPYGGSYPGDNSQPQQPYRQQQPAWAQNNLKSIDGGMYLQLNGQGDMGVPHPTMQQHSYNQHNQGYSGSPQQDHPPPIRERPPYPTPTNHHPTSFQNNFSDDQEAYELPTVSSPHHTWRSPPPVPDQTAKQRRDRSPAPSPKGPLSRENSAGSSGSSGSGNHGDSSDTSYRGGHDGFPTLKPTSNFPGHGFPLRPPPTTTKPGAKCLPKMTPIKHDDSEKPAKPKFGLPFTGLRKPTPITKPTPIAKPTPIPKPKPQQQGMSLSSVISPNQNLANILSRSPHDTPPPPASKFPYFESPQEEKRISSSAVTVGRSLESQPWFMSIDRKTAENKISQNRKEGCFVVRPGASREHPYSLTVSSQNRTYNLRIRCRDDRQYALGSEKENERAFSAVVDMIEYYMCSPLILAAGKGSVTLSGPPQCSQY